jgi:hypothetical protein
VNTRVALTLQRREPFEDDGRQTTQQLHILLAPVRETFPTTDQVDAFLTAGHVKGESALCAPPRRNDQGMTKP